MNDVRVGKDGWLFLDGGTNSPARFYKDPTYFTDEHIRGWTELLLRRKEKIKASGAKFLHLFAPDKISVYFDYYGEDLPYYNKRPNRAIINRLSETSSEDLIYDTEKMLISRKPEVQSYWKTDTHWCPDGTFAAYEGLCSKLGMAPTFDLASRTRNVRTATFDLGAKLSPPRQETGLSCTVNKYAKRVGANALVEEADKKPGAFPTGLLSGSSCVFRNYHELAHDRKILLFGDSYSEVRLGSGLTSMLAETFRELHFYWSSSVDMRIVEAVKPDIVISQIAERFTRIIPDDNRDLVAYANERLERYKRSQD